MWTRVRQRPSPATPDAEEWAIRYNGRACGKVWRVRDLWCWVTWTLPHEAGNAPTMTQALQDARAAVLRTDGTLNQIDRLIGPDFAGRGGE